VIGTHATFPVYAIGAGERAGTHGDHAFPAIFWGLATGEWKGAPRQSFGYLSAGLAVLIVALVITAAGARR